MDRRLLLGSFSFGVLTILFALPAQVALEFADMPSEWAGFVATHLVAVPAALFVARRIGRISHAAAFAVSLLLLLLASAALVVSLENIAAPAGGGFGPRDLLHTRNLRGSLIGGVALIVGPQLWLLLFNRRAANRAPRRAAR